jgi:5-formyltetrahydrofolate cyclo-ligase
VSELADKAGWRSHLQARRRAMAADRLSAAARDLEGHLLGRLVGVPAVAAYVPVDREPGSLGLLDALRGRGTVVLLPVILRGRMLDWSPYAGPDQLVSGPFGTLEPAGPRLGVDALGEAGVILVPALAVDHVGIRLGRGAGYYDRALSRLASDPLVAALLHDGELVPRLPADPWDRPVHAAVTPARGWTELPCVTHHGC